MSTCGTEMVTAWCANSKKSTRVKTGMLEDKTKQFNAEIYSQLRRLWKFDPKKCLFSKECDEGTIKAHSVPRTILSGMQEHGHVLQPANRISNNESGKATGTPMFQSVGIHEASTGYFVCRRHDDTFREIDTPEPDLSNQRILDLLMYRACLKELWIQIKTIDVAKEVGKDIALPPQMLPEVKIRAIFDLASKLKYRIGKTRDTTLGDKTQTKHIVRKIKTELPFLAASSAGSSSDMVWEEYTGSVLSLDDTQRMTGREPNTSWTITVIPSEQEHAVIVSCLQGSYIENRFSHIQGANGADLEEAISAELLLFCENWFIHPAVWRRFGSRRRESIQETFDNFDQLIEGGYDFRERGKNMKWHEFLGITNRHQINLFRH